MNAQAIDNIAAAILYEGYLLYPYRASAIKNRQRWNFGVLYPRSYTASQGGSDSSSMQTECLLRADSAAQLSVRVRFLHLIPQMLGGQEWQGAMEREIALESLPLSEVCSHGSQQAAEVSPVEHQRPINALVMVEATSLPQNLYRIRVQVSNTSADASANRNEALLRALVSTHTILTVEKGDFISLLDPPEELRAAAATCHNVGTWPVLVGEEGTHGAMLSSPIILYDYPQIAPESPGALFDGTEIDEILTLRILTLTDEEKLAMQQADDRTREILARTESMAPEQFLKMHGVLRGIRREGDRDREAS